MTVVVLFVVIEGNSDESVTKASEKVAKILEEVGWCLCNQIFI